MSGQLRLQVDGEVCIGSGNCVLADDRVFDQDDNGTVVLLDDRPTDAASVRQAVANCPSGALRLAEEGPHGC